MKLLGTKSKLRRLPKRNNRKSYNGMDMLRRDESYVWKKVERVEVEAARRGGPRKKWPVVMQEKVLRRMNSSIDETGKG